MCVDRAAAETAVCAKNGGGGETGARRDLVPRQSPKTQKRRKQATKTNKVVCRLLFSSSLVPRVCVHWLDGRAAASASSSGAVAVAPAAGIKSGERGKAKTAKMAGQYHKL